MVLTKKAVAGTMESSDVYVEMIPADELTVEVQTVAAQFEPVIRDTTLAVLNRYRVTGAAVRLVDRGALDCVIRARVEMALERAGIVRSNEV